MREREQAMPEVQDQLYVVGLGTSAGGLEALERFFSNMPEHPQIAFLVVQHLSPDYKSHMVELLSKYTPLTVHEAKDGAFVRGGNIYLLPPRKNMTIFNNKLYLVEYDRGHGLNLPIDIMLESLAKDQGNKAIACILSGTGSDGTRGIRAIKEHGGIVLAQDDTAKFDGMPRSAISTQLVDFIASAESMPEIILRYVTHPNPINKDLLESKSINDQDMIGKILAILRDHIDVDFTGYKPNMLVRRIERRMSLFEIESLENYIHFLQQSDSERRTLFKEFLIGVTSFFRDREAFEFIQTDIIPSLMAQRTRTNQLRIWVAGCSTGEEAYSLAILFQDYMERTGHFVDLKVFATDIDREALERAGRGIFPESVLADIPATLLNNYFVKQGDQYEVVRQIRSMVVFANHNLIKDPPFSRLDLISCRNLLIYMQPEIQNKILSIFEFSLNPGGFLFLGSSESLGEHSDNFIAENNKWKIHRFRGNQNPLNTIEMNPREPVVTSSFQAPMGTVKASPDWRMSDPVLRSLVENVLPPCLVVDENLSIIHAFGAIDDFVRAPRGYQINLNVMNMLHEELAIPVSTALHRTFRDGEDVTYRSIQVGEGDERIFVNLTVRVFWERARNQRLAIILFSHDTANTEMVERSSEVYEVSAGVTQRIENLEQELQYTRENLQSTIEELETSNEELQATNEELMAANEELQSTNEELESVNEELLTVNNEYQAKIRELSALNDDINNLLKSIDIGTLFLDAELRIRKFTPAAQQYFNLIDQDIGRPIAHLAHRFIDFDLIKATENVLESLVSAEYEVQNDNQRWLQVRIVPYRTYTDQINGAVLTMVDITELKRTISKAEDNTRYAQVILNSLSAHIAVLDADGTIISVNHAWEQFSRENGGIESDIGTNYLDVCRTASGYNNEGARHSYEGLRALLNGEIQEFDLEYPCHSPDEERWFLLRAVPLNTQDGRVVVSHINITDRKRIENELHHIRDRLELVAIAQPLALFEHDLTLRYIWIQNTGVPYPDEQDALNQTDLDLLLKPEAEHIIGIKRLAIKRRERLQETVEITNAMGQHVTCQMIIEPTYDDRGNLRGLIGLYRDFDRSDQETAQHE